MDPEPIQDILASLEMTNETKKRLDNLQGWAKDLKVRVVPQSFFGIFIRVVYIFLKRRRRIFERETSRQRVFLSSVDLSLSLSFLAFAFWWLPRLRDDLLLLTNNARRFFIHFKRAIKQDAPPLSETPEFEYIQKLPKSLTQQPSSVLLDASQPHAMSSPSKKNKNAAMNNNDKENNAAKKKKRFGDDFSQEQEEEELDGDYVSPEQKKKEEEERERKEAAMNHNGDVRMELKPRTSTEWLQGQKKRVRVEFEEESSEEEEEEAQHQEKDTEEETEEDEEIIPTQRPSPNESEDDEDALREGEARDGNVGIMKRTLNAAVGMIETVVNIVRSPFKSPNKRARIDTNGDTPPPSPGIFGFGGSPFAKGIAMTPKSLAKVIDATGAAAGENNANVAKMEWGAKGGETWQQKEEDEGELKKKRAARKRLVLDDGDGDGGDDDDDDENVEEEEEVKREAVKKSPKKAKKSVANPTGKPTTKSVVSEIASQVTEVASEANWELLSKLVAEREKEKKAPRELGLNVDRTRRMSRRM